jgi:hypothetical protein
MVRTWEEEVLAKNRPFFVVVLSVTQILEQQDSYISIHLLTNLVTGKKTTQNSTELA